MTTSAPRVTAVVPLRGGAAGKTRMAGLLAAGPRADLVAALARHVIGTLLQVREVGRVLVVTADTDFAGAHVVPHALPEAARVEVVTETGAGLSAAVAQGETRARELGARRLLVLLADLPLVGPDDVRALLAARAGVALAPDRSGTGTNALVLDVVGGGDETARFRYRYGPGSRAAHLLEAARLGLTVAHVRRPGTAEDLDTPEDWLALPMHVRDRLVGVLA